MRMPGPILLLMTALLTQTACREEPAAPAHPLRGSAPLPTEPTAAPPAGAENAPAQKEEPWGITEIKFTVKVTEAGYLSSFHGSYVPVHFDPRFFLTVEVLSCINSSNLIFPRETVTLGIHSPSQLFVREDYVGKTWDMTVERERTAKGVHYQWLTATLHPRD